MKNLELLLINPGGSRKKVYQKLNKDFYAIEPPFWAALTAGFIRTQGHSVEILDANAENLTSMETANEIERRNPDLTGIIVYGQQPSASTQLMTSVGELCIDTKNLNPERKIILSGLHPSALPRRTLSEEACDYVCEGEGFQTIKGLLDKKSLDQIPGLWYKKDDKIDSNPRARNTQNLTEELKDVAWDLLPFDKKLYKAHNWQCLDDFSKRPNYASISTSVGCPFACNFCSIHKTFGERKVRYWTPEWVVNQMEELTTNYGVNVFKIIDETFILNSKHYLSIADKIIERGLGNHINTWAYARVDTIKHEHLEKIRIAGFKWLSLGFESGNAEILNKAHKGKFTPDDMIKVRETIRQADINIMGNYMFGFPDDTKETMQQTLDLAIEQNCEFVNFYSAIAYPGSEIYDKALKEGTMLPEKWQNYSQHSKDFIPLPTKTLSPKKVLAFRDKAFEKYFSNPKYLDMIESKFGTETREHIQTMNKLKLKRTLLENF